MNSSSGSPINPFECFQRPRFVITKNRGDSFNPFNLNKNDSNENDFNFSIKFKTKHKQDSGINPFQSAYKDKAPFLKGIQNTHTLIKGLNKNDNKDNIANKLKNNQPMIFQPNINNVNNFAQVQNYLYIFVMKISLTIKGKKTVIKAILKLRLKKRIVLR